MNRMNQGIAEIKDFKKSENSGSIVHLRQCIACRCRKNPKLLIRLVVIGDSLVIDLNRVQPGRGAHVCYSEACVLKLGKKGLLAFSFRLGVHKRAKRKGAQKKSSRLNDLDGNKLLPDGKKSSDSIIQGVDAVMEKLLARINDKDSHI